MTSPRKNLTPTQRLEMYSLLREHCRRIPDTTMVQYDAEWSDERIASAIGSAVQPVTNARRAALGNIHGARSRNGITVAARVDRLETMFNTLLDRLKETDLKIAK